MKRALICTVAAALLAATVPAAHAAEAAKKIAAIKTAAAGTERADAVAALNDAQEKLIGLAEATPAEKFGWRPGEGVRSVGEVYLHVAQANYFIPTIWGAKPPAGVDAKTMEKDGGDKAKTIATLKKSFDDLHAAIDAVPDSDLGRNVEFFGRKGTVQGVMLILATHAHEHLGQSIAYARMNGIVPPWTAAQAAKGAKND